MTAWLKSKSEVSGTPKTLKSGTPSKSNPKTPQKSGPQALIGKAKANPKTCIIISVLGAAVVALLITVIVILLLSPGSSKLVRNVCETPECITLAQQLHNWGDKSVDPCQDFYKYSCGKFNEHSTTQGHLARQSSIVLGLINEFLIKDKPTNSKTERLMHALYKHCLLGKNPDTFDLFEQSKTLGIMSVIRDIGSWPMIEDGWTDQGFDFSELSAKMATFINGESNINVGLFTFAIPMSPRIFLVPSAQGFWNHTVMYSQVFNFMAKNQLVIYHNQLVQDINDVLDFANQIVLIFDQPVIPQTQNTFQDLESAYKNLNFDGILGGLTNLQKNTLTVLKQKLGVHPILIERAAQLDQLLENTDARIKANYLFVRFFQDADLVGHMPFTSQPCHLIVTNSLPAASIRVFVRNHFDKGNLKVVSDLVETIRENFLKMLEDSTWLSEKTKKFVMTKAKTMSKVIGYPEEFEKDGELDRRFDVYPEQDDSFFTLAYRIRMFQFQEVMEYVSGENTINPTTLTLEANANYNPLINGLTVLAPIIDDPVFHSSYPTYAKLAGVGFILAHEIGHGFDVIGQTFDQNGNPGSWWQAPDTLEFQKRSMCLISQYNNYNDPDFGRGLNGTHTLKENQPDLMASDVTWRAFKGLDMEKEPKIVGFEDYSPEKLFFQVGALNWCATRSPLSLEQLMQDPHGTNSFRVNGVFSNRKQFAEAFNCPVGSPMNPSKKCELF